MTLSAQAVPTSSAFGQNVIVFNPSMPLSLIKSTVDAISAQQIPNQFGTQRVALLFEPGTYGTSAAPLNFKVGYYTEVAGLGTNPGDVVINGSINVYNQCFSDGCNALDNFWRSMSNLTINVVNPPGAGCYSGEFWAVSQASPLRRVQINNNGSNVTLMDYCTGPSYASGGFIADSQTGASVVNGSQQQFYVRNSRIGGWSNGVWNQVFSGVTGAPAQSYPNQTYTTLTSTPVSRERPYLTEDANKNFGVFVPAVQRNGTGTTWSATSSTPGKFLSLDTFFVATPTTPVGEINLALLLGKNLLLTPGVYALKAPIIVERPNTVVLGLGFPTLVPQNGTEAITVADVDNLSIAGLILDAGPRNSPALLKMGFGLFGFSLPTGGFFQHINHPSLVSDVFFRIGGATAGKATNSLEVDSSDVILDDIWAWRADHGTGAGWTLNTADHGLVVNGDRVTATGLAVEHYQKQQVLWNGNNGETIFYQSELPYDPPSQAAWKNGSANGYASYAVSNSVNSHQAFGLGVYSFFNLGVNIVEDNAITVPAVGTTITDAGTVFLNGSGQITHVINGIGGTANSSKAGVLQPVTKYPQ